MPHALMILSRSLIHSLTDVDGGEVGTSDPQLDQADQGLDEGDGSRDIDRQSEGSDPVSDWNLDPLVKVQQVQASIEHLIACTHGKEDGPAAVVDAEDGILTGIYHLVTRLPVNQTGPDVCPVAADVDDHAEQEEKAVIRVKGGENGHQSHG